jgi:hypothetical protein
MPQPKSVSSEISVDRYLVPIDVPASGSGVIFQSLILDVERTPQGRFGTPVPASSPQQPSRFVALRLALNSAPLDRIFSEGETRGTLPWSMGATAFFGHHNGLPACHVLAPADIVGRSDRRVRSLRNSKQGLSVLQE